MKGRRENLNRDAHRAKTFNLVLAGNPGAGKQAVFNGLNESNVNDGKQNAAGESVCGSRTFEGKKFIIENTPDANSLIPCSLQEEAARDAICFGNADAVIAVCGDMHLKRNLRFVLQNLEVTDRVVVCVKQTETALERHVEIDLEALEFALGFRL